MHSKAARATKAEKKRWDRMRLLGCIACRKRGLFLVFRAPVNEIHHLKDCGFRRGHRETICLCDWHHRGELPIGQTKREMTMMFGPSFAHGSKPFKEEFGTDDELLAYQNALLDQHD